MDDEELLTEGVSDYIDGNESYACRYLKGVMYSQGDGISLGDINGSEGFMETVWEKIKQFIKWFLGLFSSKKDVGIATKEIGLKRNLPKATKETIKVTPVVAHDIKPEAPAPKAHAPTAEQKTKDKVEIKVVEIAHPDKAVEPKLVELIMVPHNLQHLYAQIRDACNSFMMSLSGIERDYTALHALIEKIPEDKRKHLMNSLRIISVDKYVGNWAELKKTIYGHLKDSTPISSVTANMLTAMAEIEFTNICYKMEHAIDANKITKVTMLPKSPPNESAFVGEFKKILDHFNDEEFSNQVAKIAVNAVRLDFASEMVLASADKFSKIKKAILDGEYVVRAPKG